MRALLLIGSLAAGVLFLVYRLNRMREEQYRENPHGEGSNLSDEDFIEIETSPKKLNDTRLNRKLPNPDDVCSVCLDELAKVGRSGKSAIIVLPCDHWFHQRCALRLMEYHPNCPICRTPIDSAALKRTPVRIQNQEVNTTNECITNQSPSSSSTERNNRRRSSRSD